jgi:hypothetical protein
MTTHDENRPAHAVRPPLWAELALRLLLQPEDAETVSGDLLEEYRDTIYPSRGRWRANLWFVRQVADFAWRGTAVWRLLVGLTAPTSFPVFTAWSVPLPAICLLLVASGRRAWRTGSVPRGALAACSISAIATFVAVAVLLMRVTAAGAPSNGPMPSLHESRPLVSLLVPMLMFATGTAVGTVGAVAGKVLALSAEEKFRLSVL